MATSPKPRDRKRVETRRENSNERGYNYAWSKARRAYLRDHPLCAHCRVDGKITPAKIVDHIQPHRGDENLFWDVENWQPLCVTCHNKKTGRGQ